QNPFPLKKRRSAPHSNLSANCATAPSWGRCPAGQRGALSRQPAGLFAITIANFGDTLIGLDRPRSFAPPSVLPDISPTRGEIG
ncbi:MAG: hypothetical protein E5W90_29385, partial [Mesorhizobium sp.]